MKSRGQTAPYFLVLIIIILMFAMITVNVNKMGFIRTDVSNAADAGALAGGSSMAYTFNEQAFLNTKLIERYDIFKAYVQEAIKPIDDNLQLALDACGQTLGICKLSPDCVDYAGQAVAQINELINVTKTYDQEQSAAFKSMRGKLVEGSEYSARMAFRYAFLNSGIGTKLNLGSATSNEYVGGFKKFLRDIKTKKLAPKPPTNNTYYGEYGWIDKSARQHYNRVEVTTGIIDRDRYEMYVTVLTRDNLFALLNEALNLAIEIMDHGIKGCPCCASACGTIAADKASVNNLLNLFLAGLESQLKWTSEPDGDPTDWDQYIICWANDIDHDLKVKVTTEQKHASSKDGGFIITKYPTVKGMCTVKFENEGDIYDPELKKPVAKFYPYIEKTDTDQK